MSPIAVSEKGTPRRHDHVIDIPQTAPVTSPPNAWRIAQDWLQNLEDVFTTSKFSRTSELFNEDSWWRDILALQWDFRTIHGRKAIEGFLRENQQSGPLSSLHLQVDGQFRPKLETINNETGFAWISSLFHFESRIGRGSGVLRLTQERPGVWKAFAVYTTLQELKGVDEPMSPAPPVMIALPPIAKRRLARSAGVTVPETGSGGAVMDEAEPLLSVIDGGSRNLSSARGTDMLIGDLKRNGKGFEYGCLCRIVGLSYFIPQYFAPGIDEWEL